MGNISNLVEQVCKYLSFSILVGVTISLNAVAQTTKYDYKLGLYSCTSDSDQFSSLHSLELRPSGYAFITTETFDDEISKNVARFEFDGDYLILDFSGSYMLFRVENDRLYGESPGLDGHCSYGLKDASGDPEIRMDDESNKDASGVPEIRMDDESNKVVSSQISEQFKKLTGEWEDTLGEPGEFRLLFKENGVFQVKINGDIKDQGVWNLTSEVDIEITVEGDKGQFTYTFPSNDVLELDFGNEIVKYNRI